MLKGIYLIVSRHFQGDTNLKPILRFWHARTHTHTHARARVVLDFRRCRILPSSGLLRGVSWSETDFSGPHIGPIFKGHGQLDPSRPTGNPETSISNHLTSRDNTEDRSSHILPLTR